MWYFFVITVNERKLRQMRSGKTDAARSEVFQAIVRRPSELYLHVTHTLQDMHTRQQMLSIPSDRVLVGNGHSSGVVDKRHSLGYLQGLLHRDSHSSTSVAAKPAEKPSNRRPGKPQSMSTKRLLNRGHNVLSEGSNSSTGQRNQSSKLSSLHRDSHVSTKNFEVMEGMENMDDIEVNHSTFQSEKSNTKISLFGQSISNKIMKVTEFVSVKLVGRNQADSYKIGCGDEEENDTAIEQSSDKVMTEVSIYIAENSKKGDVEGDSVIAGDVP